MSGEFEAAGAMATAGLAAGAIEGSEPGKAGEGACLNCGAPLTGSFCAQCGQSAHPHRSLWHLAEEVAHGLFHFDTKAWRTLPMVIFRPGTLTHNFVYGQRARYISPLATFLLCVFFMFFAFSMAAPPVVINDTPATSADAQEELDNARAEVRDVGAELQTLRREMAAPGAEVDAGDRMQEAALQRALARAQGEVTRREAEVAGIAAAERAREPGLHVGTSVDPNQTGPVAAITTRHAPDAPLPPATSRAPTATTSPTPAAPDTPEVVSPYPPGSLENLLYRVSQSGDLQVDGNPGIEEHVRHKLENPPLLLYQLQDAASKFSFLLVPISLPFIAFLFLFKRGITLYDHTVFALYGLSFASLLFVVLITTGSIPWLTWLPGSLITFGLPIHTYFHLKGAYGLRWWSALWRTFFLLLFALFSLTIFLSLILIVGFVG